MVASIGKFSPVFFVQLCLTFTMFFNQSPTQLQLKAKAGSTVRSCERGWNKQPIPDIVAQSTTFNTWSPAGSEEQ